MLGVQLSAQAAGLQVAGLCLYRRELYAGRQGFRDCLVLQFQHSARHRRAGHGYFNAGRQEKAVEALRRAWITRQPQSSAIPWPMFSASRAGIWMRRSIWPARQTKRIRTTRCIWIHWAGYTTNAERRDSQGIHSNGPWNWPRKTKRSRSICGSCWTFPEGAFF